MANKKAGNLSGISNLQVGYDTAKPYDPSDVSKSIILEWVLIQVVPPKPIIEQITFCQ